MGLCIRMLLSVEKMKHHVTQIKHMSTHARRVNTQHIITVQSMTPVKNN
jgi:hypothetical protein